MWCSPAADPFSPRKGLSNSRWYIKYVIETHMTFHLHVTGMKLSAYR